MRSPHVRAVLEDLVTKPRQRPKRNGVPGQPATYSHQTIKHLRAVMHRLFDPLYFETAVTQPVDFHSFRRGFNTALAEAGINVQTAMALAPTRTHERTCVT